MMTEQDLTEMYVHMADRDADASLDALKAYNEKRDADTKKNDFLNSIPLTKTATNTGDSLTKEKDTTIAT